MAGLGLDRPGKMLGRDIELGGVEIKKTLSAEILLHQADEPVNHPTVDCRLAVRITVVESMCTTEEKGGESENHGLLDIGIVPLPQEYTHTVVEVIKHRHKLRRHLGHRITPYYGIALEVFPMEGAWILKLIRSMSAAHSPQRM